MPGLTPEQLQMAIERYRGTPASQPLQSNIVDPWSENPQQDAQPPAASVPFPDAGVAQGESPQQAEPPLSAPGGTWASSPVQDAPPEQEVSAVQPAATIAPQIAAPRSFDESMQAITSGAQQQAEALRDQANAQAASNSAQAEVYGQQAQELAAQQEEFKRREEEYRKVNAETTEEFKSLNQQAENMRVVDRRGTSQKVMGILGVAFAGLGDAFSRMGGNNQSSYANEVQNQVNYAVERDMAAQREAISDKRKAAAAKLTELGLAKSAFDNEQQSEAFAASQIQLKYASQLKQVASSTANQQVAAAAELAAANLMSQATETQAKLIAERDKAKLYSRAQSSRAGGGAGGGGAMSSTEVLRKLDQGEPMTKAEREFALKLDQGRDRDQRIADQKTAREEAAKRKAGGSEGGIIPGYEPIDTSIAPQGPGGVAKAKEIAAGVAGVRSAGERMASLYEQIQQAESDGDSAKADLLRSRYYTTGGQFLVQKSLAGGQGVINSADAERDAKEGAVPPPPGAPASLMSKFTNLYKGVSPSSEGIRSITQDITSDGESRLGTYNLRPKRGGGERVQAPTAAGQAGASATPKQAGSMVRMRLPDGRVRDIPAENVGKAESLGATRL